MGVAIRRRAYLGRAGQLAVMAELAERGWNVAVPELDFGDDIVVLDDASGALRRIQVKTARARPTGEACRVKFKLGLAQLLTKRSPDLLYVLVVRAAERWEPFLVVTRNVLAREHLERGVGNVCDHGRGVLVVLTIEGRQARAAVARRGAQRDFSRFVGAWEPHLPRLLLVDAEVGQ